MGRNTKYNDEVAEKAKYYARDGLTDEEIAKKLGIGIRTFYQWQKKYPHFRQSLKENKEIIDYQVESALLKRALGYEYEETEVTASKDGKTTRVKKIKKMLPPDTTAAIIWLKNRQPEKWRDRKENSVDTKDTQNSIDEFIKATDKSANEVEDIFNGDGHEDI